jgi:iron(III) transport system substrate-binding protein
VDWLGSKKVRPLLGHSDQVTRPGVPSLVQADANLIKYDAIWAAENQKRIMSEWKEKVVK